MRPLYRMSIEAGGILVGGRRESWPRGALFMAIRGRISGIYFDFLRAGAAG